MEVLNQFIYGVESLVEDISSFLSGYGLPLQPWIIYVSFVSFFVFFVFFLIRGRTRHSRKGDTLFILGLSNSGKSALFGRFCSGEFPNTVTSIKSHESTVVIPGLVKKKKSAIHIVDYPGHERLREGLHKLLPSALGVIFMVDANADTETLKKSSDMLYMLLTNKHIYNNEIPVHIACNKSEMLTSKPLASIQSILEDELNEVRSSRVAAPGQDEQENQIFLGTEKRKFTFSELPFPVNFGTCSVKSNDLKKILEFIDSL